MDRKSIIIIAGCLGLLVLWQFVVVPKLTPPPKPVPPGASNTVANAQSPSSPATTTVATAASPAAVAPTTSTNALRVTVNTNVEEQLLVITNDDARYTF